MRIQYGQELPVPGIYRCFDGACGKYQGGKMAAHLAPDRFSSESVPIEKVAQFYFSYEAMLLKDAVDGGTLSSFNIAKELQLAVEEGALEQVELICSHPGVDTNGKDASGTPLLHLAISMDNTDIVSALLKNKADPNVTNLDGNTGIYSAIEDGNMILLNELLHFGANVNLADKEGTTPLMFASAEGNDVAVRMLLQAGADRELKNADGETALTLSTDDQIKEILEQSKSNAAEGAAESYVEAA